MEFPEIQRLPSSQLVSRLVEEAFCGLYRRLCSNNNKTRKK